MKKFNVGDLVEICGASGAEEYDGLRLFVVGYETLPALSFEIGAYAEYKEVHRVYATTDDPVIREDILEDLHALSVNFIFFAEENLTLIRPANNTKE